MGALGRNRCFIFIEVNKSKEVKIPSDLLGLEKSEFVKSDDGNWKTVVRRGCKRVLEQVFNEGKLYRLPHDILTYTKFRDRITGHWWNKANEDEAGSVAFVSFKPDEAYNSIKINGMSFSNDGKVLARWESQIVSLIPKEEKLIYHWKGTHMNSANLQFSGFGEINFESQGDSGKIVRGNSRFFDINEAKMEESVVKARTLLREADPLKIEIMLHGLEKKRASIIQKTLKNW